MIRFRVAVAAGKCYTAGMSGPIKSHRGYFTNIGVLMRFRGRTDWVSGVARWVRTETYIQAGMMSGSIEVAEMTSEARDLRDEILNAGLFPFHFKLEGWPDRYLIVLRAIALHHDDQLSVSFTASIESPAFAGPNVMSGE